MVCQKINAIGVIKREKDDIKGDRNERKFSWNSVRLHNLQMESHGRSSTDYA